MEGAGGLDRHPILDKLDLVFLRGEFNIYQPGDGRVTVTVPRLELYEIVVFEFGEESSKRSPISPRSSRKTRTTASPPAGGSGGDPIRSTRNSPRSSGT